MESAESEQNRSVQNAGNRLLTMDDVVNGGPVKYDAMVLYAEANQAFVDELAEKMKEKGLRLFTGFRNRLAPSQMQHDLVCELIASRCHNIVLIYSPEFFNSVNAEDAGKRAEAERQDTDIQFYAAYTLGIKIEQNRSVQNAGNRLLTMDDVVNGGPVKYDAMVLYAEANQAFVDELAEKMKEKGLRLFTGFRNRLAPSQMQHDLVCELIASRCHNIVLIYSPEFFNSVNAEDAGKRAEAERQDTDIQFYAAYTLGIKIASKGEHRMIPCMYEECALPKSHRQNHMLYVNSKAYEFYERLANVLRRSNARSPPFSSVPTSADIRGSGRD